jgi:ferritin-like metal-binding protein YciE
MEETADQPTSDAALIASAQRVEHYEIAAYGCARAYAEQLGFKRVVQLINSTIGEEGNADKKLTELSTRINAKAMAGTGSAS